MASMRNSLNSKSCCAGWCQETENVNSLRTLFRNMGTDWKMAGIGLN